MLSESKVYFDKCIRVIVVGHILSKTSLGTVIFTASVGEFGLGN